MNIAQFSIVMLAVFLNSIAQLVLKAGTNSLKILYIQDKSILENLFRIIFQPYIFSGLILYVISFAVWIIVLTKLPVSVAYPLLSIGYIISLIFAWYFFGEIINITKVMGILFIIIGTVFLTR